MSEFSKPLDLVFSLDYEKFGDGSGCVYRDQIIPTSYLASVLQLYGARLTVFVEVGQQLYYSSLQDWDQVKPIENQIRNLYRKGHGIELHIHPMWFFANAQNTGPLSLHRYPFDLSLLCQSQMEDIISKSVNYLKRLIEGIDSGYRPLAYRAGAWSMSNRLSLFSFLRENGIEIDSTIAPGAKFHSSYGSFDYTNYKMEASWAEDGLLEIPILTEKSRMSVIHYCNYGGIKTRRLVSRLYKNKLADMDKGKIGRLTKLFNKDYCMADYNFIAPKKIFKMIMRHYYNHVSSSGDSVPVVLIGHSKTSYYSDRLHELFHLLQSAPMPVRYRTISDFHTNK